MSEVGVLEEPIIRREAGGDTSEFQSVNSPEEVALWLYTPCPIEKITEVHPLYVDAAIFIEAPDRRGWERYNGQTKENGFYVAGLNKGLSTNHNNILYDKEYHRLTRLVGDTCQFRGILRIDNDASLTDTLEFSGAGREVTAYLKRKRRDQPHLTQVIDFRLRPSL